MAKHLDIRDVRKWLGNQSAEYRAIVKGVDEGRFLLSDIMGSATVRYLLWLYTKRFEALPNRIEYSGVRKGLEQFLNALGKLDEEEIWSCSVVDAKNPKGMSLYGLWLDASNQQIIACIDFTTGIDEQKQPK